MGLASKPIPSLSFEDFRRDFRDRRTPGETVNQYDERAEIERFIVHLMHVVGCADNCVTRNLLALRKLSFAQLVNWSICVHQWTIEQWENVWQDKATVFAGRLAPGRPRLNDRWQTNEYENAVVSSALLDIEPCNIYPPVPYNEQLVLRKNLIDSANGIPTLDEWIPDRPPDEPPEEPPPDNPPGEPPTEGPPPTGTPLTEGGQNSGSDPKFDRQRPPRQRFINPKRGLGRFPGLKGPDQEGVTPVTGEASAPPEVTAVGYGTSVSGPFTPPSPPPVYPALSEIWFQPTFTDADLEDAIQFQVQVSTDSFFLAITHWDSGIQGFSAPQPQGVPTEPIQYLGAVPPAAGYLYWRIRVWDEGGQVSPWFAGSISAPLLTFHSAPLAPDTSPVTDLLAFSFDDISYGVSAPYVPGDPLFFEFRATDAEASDIVFYHLQVSLDPTFSMITSWDTGSVPVLFTSGSTISSVAFGGVPLIPDQVYYFRVRTADAGSMDFGPWSGPQAITVLPNNAPPEVTGLRIHTGFTDLTGSPLPGPFDPVDVFGFSFLYYDADLDAGSTYQIQVSTDSGFGVVSHWDSTETAFGVGPTDGTRSEVIVYSGSALTNAATYHVRFRARDTAGNLGPWSPTMTFQTTPFPVNLTPVADNIWTSNDPILQGPITFPDPSPLYFSAEYTDPEGLDATAYQWQLATDQAFTSIIWDTGMTVISGLASGSRQANVAYGGPGLSLATTYYVRVRYWDDTQASPWEARDFTTAGT